MNCKPTAILFFAQTPAAEQEYKRLAKRKHARETIARAFNIGTLEKLSNLDLPLFTWDEHRQQGCTFGEKLTHAVNTIFAKGYENIIIIGNDCPQLRSSDIILANKKLQEGYPVIGPDKAGGAYLIGIRRGNFNHEKFKNLPWQTEDLAGALGYMLSDCKWLTARQDIDTVASFENAVKAGDFLQHLQWKLISLLRQYYLKPFSLKSCPLAEPYYPSYSLRGPPVR